MHAQVCEAYESTRMRIARDSKQVWWCITLPKRVQLYEVSQSCAQTCSYAPGNEDLRYEGRGWQKKRMGKAHWQESNDKSKRKVIEKALKEGKTVHFATLVDSCHLKNAKLDEKIQKYKGRVVTRGDFVQNDLDSYAVFTGQESSASHMTAAKVLDVIFGLPGCAGLASDVLPAYTHLKIEDAPELLRLPQSECPAIWTCRPWPRRPNSWDKIQDPVVPRKRNCYGHSLPR